MKVTALMPVRDYHPEYLTKAVDSMTKLSKGDLNGLSFHVTGPSGYAADSGKAFSQGGSSGTRTICSLSSR